MPIRLDPTDIDAGVLNGLLGLPRRCCFCGQLPKARSICPDTGFRHDHLGPTVSGYQGEEGDAHWDWRHATWTMLHAGAFGDAVEASELLAGTASKLLEQDRNHHFLPHALVRFIPEAVRYSVRRGWQPLPRQVLAKLVRRLAGKGALLHARSDLMRAVILVMGDGWVPLLDADRRADGDFGPRLGRTMASILDPGGVGLAEARLTAATDRYKAASAEREAVVAAVRHQRAEMLPRSLPDSPGHGEALLHFAVPGVLALICRQIGGEAGRQMAYRLLLVEDNWTLEEAHLALSTHAFDPVQQLRIQSRMRHLGHRPIVPPVLLAPGAVPERLNLADPSPDFGDDEAWMFPLLGRALEAEALVYLFGPAAFDRHGDETRVLEWLRDRVDEKLAVTPGHAGRTLGAMRVVAEAMVPRRWGGRLPEGMARWRHHVEAGERPAC